MSEAAQYFYFDQARNRHGPFPEVELARLIREGSITRGTMIWSAGMADWTAAGEVDRFASLFAGQAQVPPPPTPTRYTPAPSPAADPFAPASTYVAPAYGGPPGGVMPRLQSGPLNVALPVWGLFGRCLLLLLGAIFIVPAPWTNTGFYRFVITRIALPNGKALTFAGKPGDIWMVFVGIALVGMIGNVVPFGSLITMFITWILTILVFRWVCTKTSSEDGSVNITFAGGFGGYIGWNLLLILSFLSIIGWAWVLRILLRWICTNVIGTVRFDFRGTGLEILWRTLLLGLGSIFIIPIPWLIRWYMTWLISQIYVEPAA